jgi:hypothetical protein
MSTLVPSLETLDGLTRFEALSVFVPDDERPLTGATGFLDWRLCGALSRALRTGFFAAAPGERLLLPTSGQLPFNKVFAFGLGKATQVTELALENLLEQAGQVLTRAQVPSAALAFGSLPRMSDDLKLALVNRGLVKSFSGSWALFASEV